MKLLTTVAVSALLLPVAVAAEPVADRGAAGAPDASPVRRTGAGNDTVSTGVARARDRLNSATSTSVLREEDIERLGARSVGDLLRDIPGLRSDASPGEGGANLTVRGLPIAATGAKFIQMQEDGLPVLEFGDIMGVTGDSLIRPDLMLSQVEVIRGGSASTFASNSPGGVINFRTKTGETNGGSVALTGGLDYDTARIDFTQGGRLSDHVRFQAGGFFRYGQGPRRTGYAAQRGGQLRLNVTREFDGGYLRVYGKHLDDRTPFYDAMPFFISGTNAKPVLRRVPGFDSLHDTMSSRNLRDVRTLDRHNRIISPDLADGQHLRENMAGLELQLDLGGWTVQERFRYAEVSGSLTYPYNTLYSEINDGGRQLAGSGGYTSYVNGDRAGERIVTSRAKPLNGNGLGAALPVMHLPVHDYGDVTNELRVSRVFDVGGELTTTAGLYVARQSIDRDISWTTIVTDVHGHGRAALINYIDPRGRAITDRGVFAYSNFWIGYGGKDALRRSVDTVNAINAPFASLNYQAGRFSVGASMRYDAGNVHGRTWGTPMRSRRSSIALDMNGDGSISLPEQSVDVTRFDNPRTVDYHYHYLSYSSGVTFRIIEPLAVFARFSRGARTPADRVLFRTRGARGGETRDGSAAMNPVRQAEGGFKFRTDALTLNLTGFYAKVYDTNYDSLRARPLRRDYKATGLEFEGGARFGLFGLTAGATYTDATIRRDRIDPSYNGKEPRGQPKLLFQATPALQAARFALGATFIGATSSYAQDENRLKIPGYVTTNAFVQLRPRDGVQLTVNANNVFDTVALMGIDTIEQPAADSQGPDGTPLIRGRPLNGRTISATLRLNF